MYIVIYIYSFPQREKNSLVKWMASLYHVALLCIPVSLSSQVGSKCHDVRDCFCFFIPLAIRSVWAMSRHSINILFINKVIKAKCFKQNGIKHF